MEKIIFFGLAVPILGFVFYLGGSAIMKGFKAKVEFAPKKNQDEDKEGYTESSDNSDKLSSELNKLNELQKSGVLTQEEFEKAKRKILDN
jgi:membrane protease subunit (stomatin/prohibitin family)